MAGAAVGLGLKEDKLGPISAAIRLPSAAPESSPWARNPDFFLVGGSPHSVAANTEPRCHNWAVKTTLKRASTSCYHLTTMQIYIKRLCCETMLQQSEMQRCSTLQLGQALFIARLFWT